jgi:hypothetical protein
MESASSGPLVHSRIFLAQYILQKIAVSGQKIYFTKNITAKVRIWKKSCGSKVKQGTYMQAM